MRAAAAIALVLCAAGAAYVQSSLTAEASPLTDRFHESPARS